MGSRGSSSPRRDSGQGDPTRLRQRVVIDDEHRGLGVADDWAVGDLDDALPTRGHPCAATACLEGSGVGALAGGEVMWVLPTADRTHVVVGLRTRPRKPGRTPRQVIRSFRPGELVSIIHRSHD